jgi:hypothetical protein
MATIEAKQNEKCTTGVPKQQSNHSNPTNHQVTSQQTKATGKIVTSKIMSRPQTSNSILNPAAA